MSEREEDVEHDESELEDEDEEVTEEHTEDQNEKNEAEEEERKRNILPTVSKEQSSEYAKSLENRGVIYLSTIPAGMTPSIVKTYLSRYGKILRTYLSAEDIARTEARKKNGGKFQVLYEEGWIEFEEKIVAKSVARALNGRPVGGHRKNSWRETLWNMRYLPKFKWYHLTDRLEYVKRVREAKLNAEISAAKRESDQILRSYGYKKKVQREEKMRRRHEEGFDDRVASKKKKAPKLSNDVPGAADDTETPSQASDPRFQRFTNSSSVPDLPPPSSSSSSSSSFSKSSSFSSSSSSSSTYTPSSTSSLKRDPSMYEARNQIASLENLRTQFRQRKVIDRSSMTVDSGIVSKILGKRDPPASSDAPPAKRSKQ